jgi:rsbT co-antagonist protein RsbR
MSAEQPVQPDQFQLLAEAALDGVVISSLEGLISYANRAFKAMSGFGDRAIGSMIADYHSPANLPRVSQEVIPQLMAEGRWQGELEHTRPDGSGWIAQLSAVLIPGPDGKPAGIGTIFRDVSEQRRNERALSDLYHRIEQSFATSPLATLEADTEGKITRWNPAAERIFGWTAQEAIGQNAIALLVPNLELESVQTIVANLLEGEATNSRNENITKDGRLVTCQWHNAVLRDTAGKVVGWLSQTEDISDQLRAIAERTSLQEQVIQAQEAALREIGTPIVPISDGVVAMPLIGAIDSARAESIIETLLEGVSASRATVAILDITGVQVVDTQVANALLRAAQAVRLLGTEVLLTGIRPEVAQTLVGLGLDLSGITTLASLQSGIAYALRMKTRR